MKFIHLPFRIFLTFVSALTLLGLSDILHASPSSGPKGYGLMTSYREVGSAIVNGSIFQCADADEGSAYYYLYLTPRMVDGMWDYLDWGGTVTLEVTTQHTFTGTGDFSYSENVVIEGPGISGSHSQQESMSSPGQSVIVRQVFSHPITANDMGGINAGGYLTVTINATANGDLGPLCGQHVGGQMMWQARGAVLRLEP